MTQSVADLLAQGTFLGVPSTECLGLIAKALACNRSVVWAFPEKQVSEEIYQQVVQQLKQRAQGVPFAYLLGEQEFWSLSFKITPDVLIPRPETEVLVEATLFYVPETASDVLELGTGSGCVVTALAFERPEWQLVAVDQSAAALSLARENATRLSCSNITFVRSDWYSSLASVQKYDAIVSNPPYLSAEDPHLSTDIRYEPHQALVSGETGLEAYEAILLGASRFLKPQGLLFLEHGYTQAKQLSELLVNYGFYVIESRRDLQGHPRVLVARWHGPA